MKHKQIIAAYILACALIFSCIYAVKAYGQTPPSTYRSNPYNIKGFNPNYQYHGIQRGGGTIDMDRNTTRKEYNRRCAYNPALCVRGYKPYD